MKILFIIFIFFYSQLHAIDERKVDVYFANGIDTKKKFALRNAKILEDSISGSMPLFYDEYLGNIGRNGKVALSYNQTVSFGSDIWESIVQKIDILNLVDKMFDTQHKTDLKKQVKAYKQSIESGHRVLVVAHSQGNLFTGDAYGALDSWMKPYFEAVSVASPRHLQIKLGTPHIAFANDIVPYAGGLFIPIGNPNGEVGSIESHAFEYYMGYPSAISHVSTNVAKTKIMRAISDRYNVLNKVVSQWKVKQTQGCGCDKNVTLTHIEPTANLDHLVANVNPLLFSESGKLYQLYDESNTTLYWVKGDVEGRAVKDEQAHLPNVCYSLSATEEIIKGSSNPDPHNGILRVVLDWDKKDIDLNLNVRGPTTGIKEEHPAYECPRENWYIDTMSGLAVGDYFVSITAPSNVDTSLMPEKIRINVKAIDKGDSISVDINDSMYLNLGDIYKIHIGLLANGRPSSHIYVEKGYSGMQHTRYRADGAGNIYTAELFLLLRQLSLGPIAGASLYLEKLDNGVWKELYSGVTTSGATLNSNGLIAFPSVLQERVLESDLLLFTARGGQDVDADDDLNMDTTPITVLGKLHAFIVPKNIVNKSFKVNILTEIAYQVVHNRVDENTKQERLFSMLDDVAQLLIKEDIDGNKIIDYQDLTSWLASFDKEALLFDYDAQIEPIVQKIYRGEDIYFDVYRLLYAGKVNDLKIENNATDKILYVELNSYIDLSALQKENFTLNNSYGKSVDFVFGIVDGKIVINPLDELVEGQSYILSFAFSIYDDQNNVYVDRQQHEFKVPDITPPVILESTIHIDENYVRELPFKVTDLSKPLTYSILGGADSALFKIRKHAIAIDRIYFKEAPNYEGPMDSNRDNIYELNISVTDNASNTTIQAIQIIVANVEEWVTLADSNMEVDENAPIGTYVGSVTVLDDGDGKPIGFFRYRKVEQWYMENFRIDHNGKVFTKKMLDYERTHSYSFQVYANNDIGIRSNHAEINIAVNDVSETLPDIHPFTGSMDDGVPAGKVVGQLYVYPGLDDEVYIELIGEGSDDFDVNSSGHITVSSTANLDYAIQKQYDLKAIASNSYGESEEVNVTIYMNIWTKQIGTIFGDYPGEIVTDSKNNVYLSGEITVGSSQSKRTFINKYNSIGKLQWSYNIDQSEKTRVSSMVVDENGTVFVTGAKATGRTYVKNDDTHDVYGSWIMALSSQGEVLWTKNLENDTSGNDYLGPSFIDGEGNIIVSGTTEGAFEGYVKSTGYDLFFAKLSRLGEIEWIKQLSVDGSSLKVNKKGAFYFWSGYELMIFDSNTENITWSKEIEVLSTPGISYSRMDYTFDSDANILLLYSGYGWVAEEEDGKTYFLDIYNTGIVKLNYDGELLWEKTYESNTPRFDMYEYPQAIKTNANNEIYFIGDTTENYYDNINKAPYIALDHTSDFFLAKLDSYGNILSSKQFGSINWDNIKRMTIDNNNDIYMTGTVNGSLDGNSYFGREDIFLMKVPH